MTKVLIVVDDGAVPGQVSCVRAGAALKQVAQSVAEVEIQTVTTLQQLVTAGKIDLGDWRLCPLTFNLPTDWPFFHQGIYQTCRDVANLRQQVNAQWQVATGNGIYWLPIIHTAKGTLYAEAIAHVDTTWPRSTADLSPSEGGFALDYWQPCHLEDAQRQPLYALGQKLMQQLAAPPAVYLMQFGLTQVGIWFDRLFPFPATPALASLGVQSPDLFACHWACLNHLPILDITIKPPVTYRLATLH
jgi:hypothetical protein